MTKAEVACYKMKRVGGECSEAWDQERTVLVYLRNERGHVVRVWQHQGGGRRFQEEKEDS